VPFEVEAGSRDQAAEQLSWTGGKGFGEQPGAAVPRSVLHFPSVKLQADPGLARRIECLTACLRESRTG